MERVWLVLLTVAVAVQAGCGGRSHDADADGDADSDGDTDGDGDGDCPIPEPAPDECYATYDCCPAHEPPLGAFCEGDLHCSYPAWEADVEDTFWAYDCQAGHFTAHLDCDNGCDERATFVESCAEPFEGPLPGATVEIGPATPGETFRAFEDGELVELTTVENCTRVPYRIRIGGADVPSCLALSIVVAALDVPPNSVEFTVAMHCGESLPILSIVPLGQADFTCDPVDPNVIDLRIDVEALGIGTATAHVRASFDCGLLDELYGLHCSADGVI